MSAAVFAAIGRDHAERHYLQFRTGGPVGMTEVADAMLREVEAQAKAMHLDQAECWKVAVDAFDARFREMPMGADCPEGGGLRLS